MVQKLKFRVFRFIARIFAKFGYELRARRIIHVRLVPSNLFLVQQVLLEKFGVRTPVIFDVGANRGQTVFAYRKAIPGAIFYCFEPFPKSYEALMQAYGRNPNIHAFQIAVSDSSGTRTFHLNRHNQTHSLLPRPSGARRYFPSIASQTAATIEVPCTTIDEFIREQGIKTVNILKFDIQGGEMAALRGATTTLEEISPALILVETPFVAHYQGEGLFHNIAIFLDNFGYSLYDLYQLNYATNGQLRYANALFVSAALRSEVLDQFPSEP